MHSSEIKKVIVIGCGVHYKDKYHSVLMQKGVEIALLIDLKSQEQVIRSFINNYSLKPKMYLFLEEKYRHSVSVPLLEELTRGLDLSQIDGVIISTEPKVRKPYAVWAARHRWHLFVDKPLTAFDQTETLVEDFDEIHSEVAKSRVRAVVSCERRAHVGYEWIREYLNRFIIEERQPLTGIDIHFAGGVWKTAEEYLHDENHPFRYGYGILLHSGYHYVDLLVNLLNLNSLEFKPEGYKINSMASTPFDHLKRGCRFSDEYNQGDYQKFGETDFMMIGQAIKDGFVITNFSLHLCGTSVSMRRQKDRLPKLQGRVRQERVVLHLGHLASIHICSIPFKKFSPEEFLIEDFSITILNSPILKGRKPVIKLDRSEISAMYPTLPARASLNGYSRQWQLNEFLEGRDGNSPLISHRDTIGMLQRIYTRSD